MTTVTPPQTSIGHFKGNIPERFKTAQSTLLVDRFMTHFIKAGGIGIMIAVFGIFLFLVLQTAPLFSPAQVTVQKTISIPPDRYIALASDEWGEKPFVVNQHGTISFVDLQGGGLIDSIDVASRTDKTIQTIHYNKEKQTLVFGTTDGYAVIAPVSFKPVFQGSQRKIVSMVDVNDPMTIGAAGYPIIDIAYADSEDHKLMVAIQEVEGKRQVHAIRLVQAQTLLGKGEITMDGAFDVTPQIMGEPLQVLTNSHADAFVVSTKEGMIYHFLLRDELELQQIFKPFEDTSSPQIASMNFIYGSVSLSLTNSKGINRVYSLYIPEGSNKRQFGLTKEFKLLPSGATYFDKSLRNKVFLIGTDQMASLRYSTTETIRWEKKLPFHTKLAHLGRKYDQMIFLDDENQLHFFKLDDPHPEAGIKAFFGKIWYEGYPEPGYEWQSTGASDDFEPKLSLVPLIIGTFKGTLYAMIFALPIAILAAIYTAQFARPEFRGVVKPIMEIMASLPSVVLGFLAALWLAPLIEDKVPSLILILFLVPTTSLLTGWVWNHLPITYRRLIKPGDEWIGLIPVIALTAFLGWIWGPVIEKWFFVVTDPVTGAKVADFRLWWPQVTGTAFEQRNSLVVGFMMGFAVIPIIFTITEDALSNVPKSLVSGSLALGASRWQTALHVVLPTAFPGIFSAVMVGLGRAVGETMIVVMATGNTPIMDFNIFSGMRTLSANIAVELPEAPYLGTLYRSLFLGALVLFIMTFIVNTIAEIIRQRLREKYRTV
ncbi:MAG: hypothetical protein COW12_00830 [Candidatus Omnitrophica bacterium CG12_big_fil_rev_8_21_14_0_65_45_16]|nr:MAG: hypothetical protein COW12_00830 [Candidatus Omnitrophica bacterium CG12_big_fil_rev_8_21_14_0_65_45_16]